MVKNVLWREDAEVEVVLEWVLGRIVVLVSSGFSIDDVVEVVEAVFEFDNSDEDEEVEEVEHVEHEMGEEIGAFDVEDVWVDELVDFEVLEELDAAGAVTTTVTGGELTLMIEYFVAVVVAVVGVASWVTVTRRVCVVFGPSTTWVEMMTLVMAGSVTSSVSMTVTGS